MFALHASKSVISETSPVMSPGVEDRDTLIGGCDPAGGQDCRARERTLIQIKVTTLGVHNIKRRDSDMPVILFLLAVGSARVRICLWSIDREPKEWCCMGDTGGDDD